MKRSLVFLLLAVAMCGCRFSRRVVNAHVREYDTSWIEPGVTTRDEVIDRIGMAPADKEGGGVTESSFHWVCSDTFSGGFDIGYIFTPSFERSRQHDSEDILIKFDQNGVVELVSRTRGDGKDIEIVEWKERR